MNLAASFVAYCPTCSAVTTSDLYCCVSCSSSPSAPSRKPVPSVFDPGATVTFHFVCSRPLPVCVSDRASRRNLLRSTFLCRNSTDVRNPGPMRSQIFHLEHFTHQVFEIVRLVIWNAEDGFVSPVHTKCFQHCAPVQTRQHRISLEATIVESFLHVRRKQLDFASRVP